MKKPVISINIIRKKNTSKKKNTLKSKGFSGRKKTAAVILLFIVGASILLYPTVSNMWNQHMANRTLGSYSKNVEKLSKGEKNEQLESAKLYNEKLKTEVVPDAFAVRDGIKDEGYEKELAVDDTGIMGRVEIPVISVDLPIYHYTTNEVLEKGAGHLLGSSLPVGGEGNHTVITAHRGLPSMRLFTDLDLIKKGDEFYIHIMDEHFAYEVDQIITVLPEKTDELALQKGKDYATLITCTPYGKNTHRLFVRGHRIPYVPKEVESRASFWRDLPWWARVLAAILGLIIAYVVLLPVIIKRKKEDKEQNKAGKKTKRRNLFGKEKSKKEKNE